MLRGLFRGGQMGVWEMGNLLLVLPPLSGVTLGGELNPVSSLKGMKILSRLSRKRSRFLGSCCKLIRLLPVPESGMNWPGFALRRRRGELHPPWHGHAGGRFDLGSGFCLPKNPWEGGKRRQDEGIQPRPRSPGGSRAGCSVPWLCPPSSRARRHFRAIVTKSSKNTPWLG